MKNVTKTYVFIYLLIMKTVFIYSISTQEEPNNIRYIGKAKNIQERLIRHLQPYYLNEGTYKSNWLKSELNKKNTPVINYIDEVEESEWEFWEQYWISQFKNWGFNLTNGTIGGDGIKATEEVINRRSKTIFDKTTIKLADDLIKFNILQEENIWLAERNCPKCNNSISYSGKTRPNIFKAIRRAEEENRCCVSCDYSSRSGSGNSFFGKSHTPELQEILRNIAPKKKVIMLDLNNKILKEFNSIREAEKKTKIGRKQISGCCNNYPHYLTAGGYKWKFN